MPRTWPTLRSLLLVAGLLGVRGTGWGEIFALPASDRLLTFEVTVPGFGEAKQRKVVPTKIRITTREGTLFQIQDKGRSYWFGFIATFSEKSGVATVSQFGIVSTEPKVAQATGPFRSKEVKNGQVVAFFGSPGHLDLRVRYLGEINGSFPDVPPFRGAWDNSDEKQMEAIRRIYGDPLESVCCVGCGPIRVCSDAVTIPGCGSCGNNGGFGQV